MKLNGDIPVAERRRGASSLPLRRAPQSTFSIQLEFLDSCDFMCPGCFVKRRNSFTQKDLDDLNHLAEQFSDRGFEMNEIILGPTDLFGCKNAEEILSDPGFISLFDHFHALTFPTTLQSDHEHIKHLVNLMRTNLPDEIYLEVFVVFDMSRYNENNEEYIALLEKNLALLEDANIIFAFNIHDQAFDEVAYQTISESVNERYNSHLKMVPSFFRSPNDMKVLQNLHMWKDKMNETITSENAESILNNMSDPYFGGYTYYIYIYKDGQLYASPFIYDFIFDNKPSLIVPRDSDGRYHIDTLFEWERRNIISQYEFATKTPECASCRYLSSCVGKKVLSFMENHSIVKCFLPRETMNYQNNVSDETYTDHSSTG